MHQNRLLPLTTRTEEALQTSSVQERENLICIYDESLVRKNTFYPIKLLWVQFYPLSRCRWGRLTCTYMNCWSHILTLTREVIFCLPSSTETVNQPLLVATDKRLTRDNTHLPCKRWLRGLLLARNLRKMAPYSIHPGLRGRLTRWINCPDQQCVALRF